MGLPPRCAAKVSDVFESNWFADLDQVTSSCLQPLERDTVQADAEDQQDIFQGTLVILAF